MKWSTYVVVPVVMVAIVDVVVVVVVEQIDPGHPHDNPTET